MDTRRSVLTRAAALALASAAPAAAAAGGEGSGTGLWVIAFLALGALVVLFQALPAVVLFLSLVRSLFAPSRAEQRARRVT